MREFVSDAFVRLSYKDWALVGFVQGSRMLHVVGRENRGFALGLHLETPFGTRLTVMKARMGRNGTVALFTDSDMFDGFTNAKGYYVALEHPIYANLTLRAALFSSEILEPNCTTNDRFAKSDSLAARFCDAVGEGTPAANARRQLLDRRRFQVDLRMQF
jgi:hypothetical protein